MKKKVAKRKKLDRSGALPAWWSKERKVLHERHDALSDRLEVLERLLEQKNVVGEQKLIRELVDGMPGVAPFDT